MKISRLVTVAFMVIGFFGVAKFAMSVQESWSEYREVTVMEEASEAAAAWSAGTIALSLERSVTQVALSLQDPIPAAFRDLITQQRSKSQELFDRAVEIAEGKTPSISRDSFLAAAINSMEQIGELRTEVDAMLAKPKGERNPKRLKDLPFDMKRKISLMKNDGLMLTPPNRVSSDTSMAFQAIQDRAWEVREFGGRARTYYAISTLNGERIPDEDLSLVNMDENRAYMAWEAILASATASVMPDDIVQRIEAGKTLYFVDYVGLTGDMKKTSMATFAGSPEYALDFPAFFDNSNAALDHMTDLSKAAGSELVAYWKDRQSKALTALIVNMAMLVAMVGIALYILSILRRRLIARLEMTTHALETLSTGNLDVNIDRRNDDLAEVGRLLAALDVFRNNMRATEDLKSSLEGVLSNALDSSVAVADVSTELKQSSEQISNGAKSQAASAQQASAAVEEMSANIRQSAQNASETEKIAAKAAEQAEASGKVVSEAVSAMQEIASKIGSVQEIARQTDLLALNAAVEAARAGEHGKGFAVVASEVRKLAERSQVSATEISELSSRTVDAAGQVHEMLGSLVPDIQRTAELVSQISIAASEQDIGADQINQAIRDLDGVIRQNAEAAQKALAQVQNLSEQADHLKQTISEVDHSSTSDERKLDPPEFQEAA